MNAQERRDAIAARGFRPAHTPVATGPCNCCACRFGHPHPCASDIGRYPLFTYLLVRANAGM